jgi:uncharacterized protein YdhG (YjbR/CyaY superfamily)
MTVDEYIASHPEGVRQLLERVRAAIRKAIPGAEESISYGIPTYKLKRRPVIYFAGWKQHFSLYPVTAGLLKEFNGDLGSCEVEKGTIRFPLTKPPVKLIARIAAFRAKEVAEAEAAKSSKARARSAGRKRL